MLKSKSFLILWGAFFLGIAQKPLFAERYVIDPAHSSVEFKVKHLLINKVRGQFDKFSGEFNYEPGKPQNWSAMAIIDAKSINTGNNDRDNHLRGSDFLETEKFPIITFKTTGINDAAENSAKLNGILTLHGMEKPVALDLKAGGEVEDPWGNIKSGFEATGKINRKDFGIVWNKVLGNGGLVVGEEIEITIQIEGTKDKAPAPPAKGKKK